MITFKDIIQVSGSLPAGMILDGPRRNTKLMFHKSEKSRAMYDPKYNRAGFETYQKEHWNTFFSATEYVFSFWYESNAARFVGCYKCNKEVRDTVDDAGSLRDRIRFPEMETVAFMEDYVDRLFIEWTNPSPNYGRYLDDGKYHVRTIGPSKDNSIGSLPKSFFEIHLGYKTLQKLFEFPVENREWQNYLQSRCGVYYVDDTEDPEYGRYVGSAYGEDGFWGRWQAYANGSDGNKDFKGRDYTGLVFSILWETLPNTDKNAIITVESEFKKALGTRTRGLNNN